LKIKQKVYYLKEIKNGNNIEKKETTQSKKKGN